MKTKVFHVRLTEEEIAKVKDRGGSTWVRNLILAELNKDAVPPPAYSKKRQAKAPAPARDSAPSDPNPLSNGKGKACKLCGRSEGEMHTMACRNFSYQNRV